MRRLLVGIIALLPGTAWALPEPKPPPVVHVGLGLGLAPVLFSTQPGTRGFAWGVQLEGDAPGIGESGLGLREIRLTRLPSGGAEYGVLFRQIRLRSSVATFGDGRGIVSWQGGVVMQDFERNGQTGAKSGVPGAREGLLGGELGARLDLHFLPQLSPYLAAGAMYGGFVDPEATMAGAAGAGGGNVLGFTGAAGVISRWPVTIPWGVERYTALIGGQGELYWWNLFNEHLLGLDFRLGVYF